MRSLDSHTSQAVFFHRHLVVAGRDNESEPCPYRDCQSLFSHPAVVDATDNLPGAGASAMTKALEIGAVDPMRQPNTAIQEIHRRSVRCRHRIAAPEAMAIGHEFAAGRKALPRHALL
jgi:hypothetical protein